MAEELSDSRDRELILEALAHVPGYPGRPGYPERSAAIETVRLPGGSVNRTYRVNSSAGRFVIRLSTGVDAWLARDRSVELRLHAIASQAGIAPRIVHADGRDRWLITEYVDGRLWTQADFADPQQLARLAATLRTLHALPAPGYGRYDLPSVLQGYADRIAVHESHARGSRETGESVAIPSSRQFDGAVGRYLDEAVEGWRVSGAAERAAALLHHDLHASNVIESPAGLVLIDWECAGVSDPLLDIACIVSYYPAATAHAELLLQESGLGSVTRAQLAAAAWLFDLHTYLWYRERRLRQPATEAELRAEQRLSASLADGLERRLIECGSSMPG